MPRAEISFVFPARPATMDRTFTTATAAMTAAASTGDEWPDRLPKSWVSKTTAPVRRTRRSAFSTVSRGPAAERSSMGGLRFAYSVTAGNGLGGRPRAAAEHRADGEPRGRHSEGE